MNTKTILGIIVVYFIIIVIRKRKCNNTTNKEWYGITLFPPFGKCDDYMPIDTSGMPLIPKDLI
tara:strand:- start:1941 stop:2132 length:192 start_codon:yes stop_codon:yes gene_type:complete